MLHVFVKQQQGRSNQVLMRASVLIVYVCQHASAPPHHEWSFRCSRGGIPATVPVFGDVRTVGAVTQLHLHQPP
jgi:hypothetical protein